MSSSLHRTMPRHSVVGEKCQLCLDSFQSSFAGTKIITLQCGHSAHWDCCLTFTALICDRCQKPAKPRSSQNKEALKLAWLSRKDEDHIPLSPLLSSPISSPTSLLSPASIVLSTPEPRPRKKSFFDEAFDTQHTPQISLVPEFSRVVVNESVASYKVPCLLQVTMPDYKEPFVRSEEEQRAELESKLVITNHLLLTLQCFSNYPSPPPRGKIAIFDVLDIEDGPGNWERFGCFLFDSGTLLLADLALQSVCGVIRCDLDLVAVNCVNRSLPESRHLVLNLSSLDVPEIKLRDRSLILLTKWDRYLQRVAMGSIKALSNVSLLQMSTNGWDIIDSSLIPADARHLQELAAAQIPIPESLGTELVPAPPTSPLRLILCVSLLNEDPIERMASVKNIIRQAMSRLDPQIDKLGVVYIQRTNRKTSSSFLVGITDWSVMESQLDLMPLEENSYGCSSLEQHALFLEGIMKLVEFWGDCKNSKANTIRKVVMITDGINNCFAASDNSTTACARLYGSTESITQQDMFMNYNINSLNRPVRPPDLSLNTFSSIPLLPDFTNQVTPTSQTIPMGLSRPSSGAMMAPKLLNSPASSESTVSSSAASSVSSSSSPSSSPVPGSRRVSGKSVPLKSPQRPSSFVSFLSVQPTQRASMMEQHATMAPRSSSPQASYQTKLHARQVPILLKKLLRHYHFSLHLHTMSDIDNETLEFVQQLVNENYHTYGSTYMMLQNLSSLRIDGAIDEWKTVTTPRLKLDIRNLAQNIEVCGNEIAISGAVFPKSVPTMASDSESIIDLSTESVRLPFYDSVYGYSPYYNPDIEQKDLKEVVEIVFNDIGPGFSKSIMVSATINLDHSKRQMLKKISMQKMPLMELNSGSGVQTVSVDLVMPHEIASARESILTQSSGVSLPLFPQPLSPDRDHVYARKQIQMLVVTTVTEALEVARDDASAAKSLLLSLISSIHAIAKDCNKTGDNSKYVDFLDCVLTYIADAIEADLWSGFSSGFELVCSLCMQ